MVVDEGRLYSQIWYYIVAEETAKLYIQKKKNFQTGKKREGRVALPFAIAM